ncbi:MAG: hypothetical protein HY706_05195 [Candidatus Hydrogenedentes bacterium]|nr:hypothetical protein [Candidatus Hydrogenedentota bacterium]
MLKRVAAILLLGTLAGACATQNPESKTHGATRGVFHGRWWNYYERGASSLAQDFHAEAEADLKEALRGRSVDSWRARTYGLHFVEYFPNRELGVAYYHLGRLDDAETYLNTSLQQIDTARAHDYLDMVKRKKLEQGALNDTSAPSLDTTIKDGTLTAAMELPLGINASDDLGVAEVRLNGRQLHQRGSATQLSFEDSLTFTEGSHTIEVDVNDLAGKESKQAININVDLTGPAIGILEPPPGSVTDAASVHLRGACADRIGVASVQMGDTILAKSDGDTRLEFEGDLPLKDGQNTFVLVAKDKAGNETHTAVSVYKGRPERLGSFLQRLPDRLFEPLRFAHVKFAQPARLYPALAGRVRFAAATAAASAEPIKIDLKFPKQSIDPYRKNNVRIAGTVVAQQTKVESITINNETFDLVSAPTVEFSKRLVVAQGQNVIAVSAKDDQGHDASQELTLNGKPVMIETPDSKMSVAVLAFGGQGDIQTVQDVRSQTESRVVEGERFNVVDRTRLQEVLNEQQLSDALGDPDRALTLGKIVPANVFLVGSVFERGPALEVYTRVVSTETARIIRNIDTHVANKNDPAKLEFGIDYIASELARTFPRVSGELVQVQGTNIMTNFGREDGVQEGMYVLVVHQTEPVTDPSTGEVLNEAEYLPVGRARITSVTDKASRAETVPAKEGELKLEARMPAITM